MEIDCHFVERKPNFLLKQNVKLTIHSLDERRSVVDVVHHMVHMDFVVDMGYKND